MHYRKTVALLFVLISCLQGCGDDRDQDTTPPTIKSVSPPNNAVGVAVNSKVKVTFSETMDDSPFLNRTTLIVRTGGTRINGTINYGGTFVTFLPLTTLSIFRGYTGVVTTEVKDSNGNVLPSSFSWGFITGSSTTSTVSFASNIQTIFDNNCTGCHHSGELLPSFLPLTNDVAYANLVNYSSTRTIGGGLRVKPSDSANSVLYQRVSGIGLDPSEQTMPQNRSLLSSDDQTRIRTWIDEGALDN